MKIVIAGAGAIGFHLAELLSKENQDITLIDSNEEVLTQVKRNLDILTIQGDAASFPVLEQAEINKSKLFISVTTSEKTNLLSAIIAKQLGAKKTIARISDMGHLEEANEERFHQMGIDVLISPERLAGMEIKRLLQRASFTDLFEFENGQISVIGFTLDNNCLLNNKSFHDIANAAEQRGFRCIALLRGHDTLIPSDNITLHKGDHLYISAPKEYIEDAMKFVGKQIKPIKRVMIVGGSNLALRTAQQIETLYDVKIVMNDEKKGKYFLQNLAKTMIICADPSDIEVLKEEGLENTDAFVALTPNSETNIITSLMAEELGVYKTIAQVENVNYTHISQNIGIDTIINKKLVAANNIFRFVRKGRVEAIASLHGVDAEIIEFNVHKKNRLLVHSIADLHLPRKSVIAGIVRNNKGIVPDLNFHLQINDKVIILALPEAIPQIEEIFK